MVVRGWGGSGSEHRAWAMGTGFVWEGDGNILELDNGDGCILFQIS